MAKTAKYLRTAVASAVAAIVAHFDAMETVRNTYNTIHRAFFDAIRATRRDAADVINDVFNGVRDALLAGIKAVSDREAVASWESNGFRVKDGDNGVTGKAEAVRGQLATLYQVRSRVRRIVKAELDLSAFMAGEVSADELYALARDVDGTSSNGIKARRERASKQVAGALKRNDISKPADVQRVIMDAIAAHLADADALTAAEVMRGVIEACQSRIADLSKASK